MRENYRAAGPATGAYPPAVARIVALAPELMFASRIEATLAAAGHDVELVRRADEARARAPGAGLLIVDLAAGDDPIGLVAAMLAGGELGGVPTLGFYSHVEADTRQRAEAAGFDLVVPRSRMAREMDALVTRLAVPAEH